MHCAARAEEKRYHDTREPAASHYGVDEAVLDALGKLSSTNGGVGATKAQGMPLEYTSEETRFLEEAVKAIIRRSAEVAHDPNARRPLITMSNLPPIWLRHVARSRCFVPDIAWSRETTPPIGEADSRRGYAHRHEPRGPVGRAARLWSKSCGIPVDPAHPRKRRNSGR